MNIQLGLGIVADVNKLTKDGKDYLEIKVKLSSFPINYYGEFHYRSGATKQQLTGIALSEFIMQKTGFRWEDVTVDDITVDDLDDESFKIFRREALSKKRMTEAELNVSNKELLQKVYELNGLNDVFYEPRTVGFDAFPFLCRAHAFICNGFSTELICADSRFHICKSAS